MRSSDQSFNDFRHLQWKLFFFSEIYSKMLLCLPLLSFCLLILEMYLTNNNAPFTFFGLQRSFWASVSSSAWYIAALSVRRIPVFQNVSDAVFETIQLTAIASSMWVTTERLCRVNHRSRRWWRQILCDSCLATNWCLQKFLSTPCYCIHTCQQTNSYKQHSK